MKNPGEPQKLPAAAPVHVDDDLDDIASSSKLMSQPCLGRPGKRPLPNLLLPDFPDDLDDSAEWQPNCQNQFQMKPLAEETRTSQTGACQITLRPKQACSPKSFDLPKPKTRRIILRRDMLALARSSSQIFRGRSQLCNQCKSPRTLI